MDWPVSNSERVAAYFGGLHQRSRRRKSPWNLLLAVFGGIGIVFCWALMAFGVSKLYSFFHGPHSFGSTRTNISGVFLYVPIFFSALTLGMIVGNILTWCVPPAKLVIAVEDETIGQTFDSANRQLLKLSLVLTAIAAAFVAIGLIEPFSR